MCECPAPSCSPHSSQRSSAAVPAGARGGRANRRSPLAAVGDSAAAESPGALARSPQPLAVPVISPPGDG